LKETRTTIVADLPGFGESDPLPLPTAPAMVAALAQALGASMAGEAVDVLGIGNAAPLAVLLALRHPETVGKVITDGWIADHAAPDTLVPQIAFDPLGGGHLHTIWHMLRDAEAQWPWFDGSLAAQRRIDPVFDPMHLHRALTGILSQLQNYGDATRAALACAADVLATGAPGCPVLAFVCDTDPAFATTRLLPGAQLLERPTHFAGAAAILASALAAREAT
jgi:pimeloyl-ACP methyl ester carboxylesterase